MVAAVLLSGLRGRKSQKLITVSTNGETVTNKSLVSRTDVVECSKDESGRYFKTDVVWTNVFIFAGLHFFALYGLVAHGREFGIRGAIGIFIGAQLSGLGITVGAHRLWSHRCFKARTPLRIFLMIVQTTAGQNSIFTWCRDHRMHHKYTETDADPHTTTRGMFFAHMGWLMMKKHPEVIRQGRTLDCSDLLADPVVRFQDRWFLPLVTVGVGLLPISAFLYLGLSPICAFYASIIRYLLLLHGTWCVNSLAHWLGDRPYDRTIRPTENLLTSFLTNGEGFHNYHHVFPFDYKAAELQFSPLNMSTVFINVMAVIGQAYDLKEASEEIVLKRKARTGDGNIY